jgi:hypothetical protein
MLRLWQRNAAALVEIEQDALGTMLGWSFGQRLRNPFH